MTDTPGWIAAMLAWPALLPVSRIALVSAFLIGGLVLVSVLSVQG